MRFRPLNTRIVFNICVHNTDNHLRNHGFLLTDRGWVLSPAYDLNPQTWPGGLALNIDENSNACELDLARSVSPYFRLSNERRESIIDKVTVAVSNWKKRAQLAGLKNDEIERMRVAFEN